MWLADGDCEVAICPPGTRKDVAHQRVVIPKVQVQASGERVVDQVGADRDARGTLVKVDPPRVPAVIRQRVALSKALSKTWAR